MGKRRAQLQKPQRGKVHLEPSSQPEVRSGASQSEVWRERRLLRVLDSYEKPTTCRCDFYLVLPCFCLARKSSC